MTSPFSSVCLSVATNPIARHSPRRHVFFSGRFRWLPSLMKPPRNKRSFPARNQIAQLYQREPRDATPRHATLQ